MGSMTATYEELWGDKAPTEPVCRECGRTGGVFRWVVDDEYVHTPQCDRAPKIRDDAKDLWGFTTSHLDCNNPVKVTSFRHMQRLEKEYGVVSRVASYDQQNW